MLEEEHKSSLMSHGLQWRLNTTCEENTDPLLFIQLAYNLSSYRLCQHAYRITSTMLACVHTSFFRGSGKILPL